MQERVKKKMEEAKDEKMKTIIGDFNTRTGEIEGEIRREEEEEGGNGKRRSKDKKINRREGEIVTG